MSFQGTLKPMKTLTAQQPWAPPEWALLERRLFDMLNTSAVEYVQRYTREDKTLIWRDNWPGMDGSDDPYEAFMNFALLYVLGGSEEVHDLALAMWEAITWQWTEYGQIHNEFDGYYDWMHHGEGSLFFYFLGLSDPYLLKYRQRATRFANFYIGRDPNVPNYDAAKKLMRSPITGSRGPRFEMTEEDWVTHRGVLDDYRAPFEDIPGVDFESGTCCWSDDAIYREIIQRMNERIAKGDVPLNLNATSLITHAYMLTGDEAYRQWVLDYLGAWIERTHLNGGITPDNIGLSGQIGEYNDGKWWGGYYGWRWPHGFMTIIEPILNASMNAVLLAGDANWLQLARTQLDENWALGKEQDGSWVTPYKHFDRGWTDYRSPNPRYPVYMWTVSQNQEDLERLERIDISEPYRDIEIPTYSGRNPRTGKETKHYIGNTMPWFEYIQGHNPAYPVQILQANYLLICQQLEKMRAPEGEPTSWDWEHPYSIHHWQEMCPVYFEGLLQMTLGAPMHISHGGLQHMRVRYYDAQEKRPGLPESVGVLVEQISDDSVTLSLVNLDLFADRDVIVQAGGFGEHTFTSAEILGEDQELLATETLEGKWVHVHLASGAGIRLRLGMRRYANRPSYETPWPAPENAATPISGRQTANA